MSSSLPSPPLFGVIIDNYDSFTYNLVAQFHKLTSRLPHCILNDSIDFPSFVSRYLSPSSPLRVDYIVLSPGPGTPQNDSDVGISKDLMKLYIENNNNISISSTSQSPSPFLLPPLFGVCLGLQLFCHLSGYEIGKAERPIHGEIVDCYHKGDHALFKGISSPFHVVRYNSLIAKMDFKKEISSFHQLSNMPNNINININTLSTNQQYPSHSHTSPLPLLVTSLSLSSSSSSPELMSLSDLSGLVHCVQFHPESICTVDGDKIVKNFLSIVEEWKVKEKEMILSKGNEKKTEEKTSIPSSPTPSHSLPPSLPFLSSPITYFTLTITPSPLYVDSAKIFSSLYSPSPSASSASTCFPTFWLDSSHVEKGRSRYSYMGNLHSQHSMTIFYNQKNKEIRIQKYFGENDSDNNDNSFKFSLPPSSSYFDYFNEIYLKYRISEKSLQEKGPNGYDFPFIGGWMGYFGYEMKEETLPKSSSHASDIPLSPSTSPPSPSPFSPSDCPASSFMFAERFLLFDHLEMKIFVISLHNESSEDEMRISHQWTQEMLRKIQEISIRENDENRGKNFQNDEAEFKSNQNHNNNNNSIDPSPSVTFHWRSSDSHYSELIDNCRQYIENGDSYELCLTNHMSATPPKDHTIDPFKLYKILRTINPAPYATFLHFPSSTSLPSPFSLCCCSPERFLRITNHGEIESKPIKGTRKRGLTPADDELLVKELQNSKKDFSENLMIVDLIRNDINKLTKNTKTHVSKLMDVETYRAVHQLVSTVRGKVEWEGQKEKEKAWEREMDGEEKYDPSAPPVSLLTPLSVIRSCFPPGSMTGAPKLRSCEILSSLEHQSRGIYSGIMGFISLYPHCSSDFNVIIRTAVVEQNGGKVTVGAGGAIVFSSDNVEEIEEVKTKAKLMIKGIEMCAREGRKEGK